MKQGFASLQELAARLTADSNAKKDFIVPASSLRVEVADDKPVLVAHSMSPSPILATGHKQIGEYTGIPAAYYDRLLARDPALLATNVNRWLVEKGDDRRMVRTLNGDTRALLSDRYQRIDNFEVAEVALNVLSDVPDLSVVSCNVTERKLYIKAVSKRITAPDPGARRVGSLIEAGVMISNSEIGFGAVNISPFANFLFCTNGMVRDDGKMRKAHVGSKIDADLEGLLSDSTRKLEDEVVLRKVRDVIKHAFDELAFRRFIDKLSETTQQHIKGDVPSAIEKLGQTIGLNVAEKSSVLRHLIEGGDLSRYGLINAVTRTAEDVDSYDRATEIESLGYKVIDLPASQWREISESKPIAIAA